MSIFNKATTRASESISTEKVAATSIALLMGSFIFLGVAFASPAQIHNAAHDVRHTMAFPCH